ncbi:hypothetical protein WN55_09733 [Dufourea novaeangliae]|uniref:Uncharacterized protein n=1 Tax=Dufourea novaeangliae TaxID=178035 RepID=A0A154P0Q3_DUFNO|nr:hypothetical protein WN55_09733 [Dufourea novaeangliae]
MQYVTYSRIFYHVQNIPYSHVQSQILAFYYSQKINDQNELELHISIKQPYGMIY